MIPMVLDKDGVVRDWDWLRAKHGNVRYLDAGEATKFQLVRVEETEGPAVLYVMVRTEAGFPQAMQPVANHWPDETLVDVSQAGMQSVWHDRACIQWTNDEGHTGFGLGAGSYTRNLEVGGPHTVWVLSPSLPSDGISGIGMLGGTNHCGPLRLAFQIMEPEHEPDEPPIEVTPVPDGEEIEPHGCLGLIAEIMMFVAAKLIGAKPQSEWWLMTRAPGVDK